MGIQSIPAVIAFANGQPADGFMGALPESQIVAFLERITKGKIGRRRNSLDLTLKAADAALAGRQRCRRPRRRSTPRSYAQDGANVRRARRACSRRLCRHRFELEPAKADARDGDTGSQAKAIPPMAAARAALELAEQAKSLGDRLPSLDEKVEDQPARTIRRGFDLALVALNSKGKPRGGGSIVT